MLGTPQGINQHIKHNITSCTGVQSLVLSGELLHYVLLPQFKSQELETNAPQTELAHAGRIHLGAVAVTGALCGKQEPCFYLYPVQKSTGAVVSDPIGGK